MALASALLLLLVMTILGIAMFRTFGTQERIAGNTRERQRALYAADSAEAYAEWWLTSQGGINATAGAACNGLLSADAKQTQVCSNELSSVVADVSTVPWMKGAAEIGMSYTPRGIVTNDVGQPDNYALVPRFYISYVSGSYNTRTRITTNAYLIDATGYGGTNNAVSVVESSYLVSKVYTTQSKNQIYQPLGGP